MQILDCRKKTADQFIDPASSTKPLPLLAAVTFQSSRYFLRFYRCTYSVIAFAMLLVFYPFIDEQLPWLIVLALLWWGLWRAYKYSLVQEPRGELCFSGEHWIYQPAERGSLGGLHMSGAALCWSWIIILPLHSLESGKTCNLLIFGDALTVSDNARLRRWLQACLVPKG